MFNSVTITQIFYAHNCDRSLYMLLNTRRYIYMQFTLN